MKLINHIKIDFDSQNLSKLAKKVLFEIDNNGYVIIKNCRFEESLTRDSFLNFASMVGLPVPHDSLGTLVWDIKHNPNSQSSFSTFSEHNHEATLHTDSQYCANPENYFALFCLKKASCNGGISFLLSYTDLVNELNLTSEGKKCLKVLTTKLFPFAIPSVFLKNNEDDKGYVLGKILSENGFRFRYDTIQKGIEINPKFKTTDRLFALDFLNRTLESSKRVQSVHLEDSDMIFINNKTMLHGRSSFTDSNRHFLRVRMTKLP